MKHHIAWRISFKVALFVTGAACGALGLMGWEEWMEQRRAHQRWVDEMMWRAGHAVQEPRTLPGDREVHQDEDSYDPDYEIMVD